jgi:hypothetical protein
MHLIRAIPSLLFLFLSTNAMAQWSAVGIGDYIHQAYADKATISRSGALVRMAGMYDFRRQDFTPEGKGLYSTVVLREYDCDKRQVRLLSAIDFSGQMGAGTAVAIMDTPRRWQDVVADSLDEAYWKLACGGN